MFNQLFLIKKDNKYKEKLGKNDNGDGNNGDDEDDDDDIEIIEKDKKDEKDEKDRWWKIDLATKYFNGIKIELMDLYGKISPFLNNKKAHIPFS